MKEEVKKSKTTKKPTTKKKTTTAKKTQPKKTTTKKAPAKKTNQATKKVPQPKVEKPIVQKPTPKEEVVSELKPKNTKSTPIKNEKMVIFLMILIIIIIVCSIIYIVVVNDKEEKRISKFTGNNGSTVQALENDIIPGTVDYKNIEEITYSQFESILQEEEKFVLLISSRTCPTCTVYQSSLSEALDELDMKAYRIETTKLNDENRKALGKAYGGNAPTTVVIKNGETSQKFEGYANKDSIIEWFQENY